MPKKKRNHENEEPKFTVQGEWFPKVYPAFCSQKWSRGEEDPLATEMRLFCSCMRWSFNRLLEGENREKLKKEGQEIFGLNSRFADDAVLKAKAVIESQRELIEQEIQETETKLSHAKKKLNYAEKDLKRAEVKGDKVRIEKYRRIIRGRRLRVKTLREKLNELQAHQQNGTIPKVIFGGRSLWKKVCKGKASKEDWHNARKNRLYSRGDRTKRGNPNLKIYFKDGEFYLSATISHLSEQIGVDKKNRPKMTRAPKVEGRLWLPEKYRLKAWSLLFSGASYTIEIIKGQDNRYRVYITFSISKPELVTDLARGYLGMDANPDGVALANVNYFGQPEPWPESFAVPYPKALHKFEGEFQVTVHPNGFLYIKVPELSYSGSYRRTYLIGVLAAVIVEIARTLGKPIALENLDFRKDRLDTNKKFNRIASNFPYKKMTEAVTRRAYKEGVGTEPVWPAHTSTIGYYKYMQKYAVTIHHAAALVIARRAMGHKERITKELKRNIQSIKEKLARKANSLPGEGEGMTRRVKRLFKRLDEKLPVHNGLTCYEQEAFYSVWYDLKELALSLR